MIVGTYPLQLPSKISLVLRDYYFVTTISKNLISVSCLTQEDYVISFYKDYYNIYFENKIIGSSFLINSLFQLYVDVFVNYVKNDVNAIGIKRPRDKINQMYLWHLRLDHIGEDRINRLKKIELLDLLTTESYPIYESCL